MRHITIMRDARFYHSHASACQAKNGDLLVAFREAPFQHIFAHAHPDATIALMRSTDLGDTWNPATKATILDPGDETNVNDPSLTTLRDGTIVLTAFAGPAIWEKSKARWDAGSLVAVRGTDYYIVRGNRRILVRRSFDDGLTWDGPYEADTTFYGDGGGGVFGNVAELSDGRILMPMTTHSTARGERIAALICSEDKGSTWGPFSEITTWKGDGDGLKGFALPSAVAYDDEHIFAAGWHVVEHGTSVTRTLDGGETWSSIREIDTNGACMHLWRAKSGVTLMSYGYRNVPYGIRVWPSYDQGRTWEPSQAVALRSDGAMRDLGYPWTIQLSDGRFFCVYYFNVRDEDKSYYDEAKSLEICRAWNLDPPLFTYQKAGLRFIGGTFFTEDDLGLYAGTATVEHELAEAGPTLL